MGSGQSEHMRGCRGVGCEIPYQIGRWPELPVRNVYRLKTLLVDGEDCDCGRPRVDEPTQNTATSNDFVVFGYNLSYTSMSRIFLVKAYRNSFRTILPVITIARKTSKTGSRQTKCILQIRNLQFSRNQVTHTDPTSDCPASFRMAADGFVGST